VQHHRQVVLEPFGNSQYRRVVVPDGGIVGIGKGQDDCLVHVVDEIIDDLYAERPTGLAGSERQRPVGGCVVARGNGRPADRSIADCDNKGRGHTQRHRYRCASHSLNDRIRRLLCGKLQLYPWLGGL
jgi:hypothetical protein